MINLLVRKWKSDDWQQSHINMYRKQNESALLHEQGMVSQPAGSDQVRVQPSLPPPPPLYFLSPWRKILMSVNTLLGG